MTIRIRIKATGQVLDMVPAAAIERLNAGTAERVDETAARETSIMKRAFETAARWVR